MGIEALACESFSALLLLCFKSLGLHQSIEPFGFMLNSHWKILHRLLSRKTAYINCMYITQLTTSQLKCRHYSISV